MSAYEILRETLHKDSRTWLVTGVAGFIGSNLLEALLKLNQRVVGLDNFSTGYQYNLDEVRNNVTHEQWDNFQLIEGDISSLEDCRRAMIFTPPTAASKARQNDGAPVIHVLHQAALGSVPRSIENPIATNQSNIDGFLNMLVAARDAKVKSFVYAASSSTYGDHPALPKIEDRMGKPLSPYAVTKLVNELYADVFARTYGFQTIGLRYFNIFGRRQNPNGAYAAVIPKWISSMIREEPVYINGNGETSRDFCYIENAIQANLLAATTINQMAFNQVYNVAVGERTSLNELFEYVRKLLSSNYSHLTYYKPVYRDYRQGDVQHSLASIEKAIAHLGYEPKYRICDGLAECILWYMQDIKRVR